MPDFRNIAKQYISNNLWVIPVNKSKKPALKDWTQFQTRPMTDNEIDKNFRNCYGIALLCGGPTKVELLDWDLKYDLSGDFYERACKDIPIELKRKMFVQSTKNNGFHWWYKIPSEKAHPNQKLANRYTTPFEKHKIYLDNYKNPKTRDKALKIAYSDISRVIAETRGGTVDRCKGYGLVSPTTGYKVIYKPEGGIQEISPEEHDFLLSTLRSYNEVVELDNQRKKKYDDTDWEVDPFEDYNDRGDTLGLLTECGWEEVGTSGNNVRLKRPGADSGSSGLFDIGTNIFNCFSTSTSFDCNKGYNPSSVFRILECEGDPSLTYKKLIDLGYGTKKQ